MKYSVLFILIFFSKIMFSQNYDDVSDDASALGEMDI